MPSENQSCSPHFIRPVWTHRRGERLGDGAGPEGPPKVGRFPHQDAFALLPFPGSENVSKLHYFSINFP